MRRFQQTLLLLLAASLAACSGHYRTLEIDEKTGLYPTYTQVDPGGTLVFNTSVDPRSFSYVLLNTRTNLKPTQLSFTVRSALAQSGITKVYTPAEFKQLAQDRGFTFPNDTISTDDLRNFSAVVGSVLVVDMIYRNDARAMSLLVVNDGRTGKALLRVLHQKTVWGNLDAEALYPVLNQLRKWIKESKGGAV